MRYYVHTIIPVRVTVTHMKSTFYESGSMIMIYKDSDDKDDDDDL